MVEPLPKRLDYPYVMYRVGETSPPLSAVVVLASYGLHPHTMTLSGQLPI